MEEKQNVFSKLKRTFKRKFLGRNLMCSLVSLLCVLVLLALFIYWWRAHPDQKLEGFISAILSTVLFALLGLRFLPLWFDAWRKKPPKQRFIEDNTQPRFILVKIFCSLLLVDIAIILLVYVLQLMSGSKDSFFNSFGIWKQTDSFHYLQIAEEWYASDASLDRIVQLVFLPGYPLAIRLLTMLTGNYLVSGMLISGLSFAGAGTMLYRLARLDMNHRDSIRAVKFLCILPPAFFFASPMSESLFLLLSVSCMFYARKKKWLFAGILGGLAAFTRSLGIVLLAPLCFEWVIDLIGNLPKSKKQLLKRIGSAAALLLVPLGFGVYCLINYEVSGNPLQFLIYQREHWHQSMNFFFNTAAYQTNYLIDSFLNQNFTYAMGLWVPSLFCTFASLITMIAAVKRLRPSYTAYFIGYFVVAIGATWLLSAPRYLLTLFPLPLALATLTKRRWAEEVLTIFLVVLLVLYSYMFVNRWSVW